jgi:phosphate transport system substrate-binding protein
VLRNRAGEWVEPTLESVTASAAEACIDPREELWKTLLDTPGKRAYPVCGAACVVWRARTTTDKRNGLLDFVSWVVHEGQKSAAASGYARIPPALVKQIQGRLQLLRVE